MRETPETRDHGTMLLRVVKIRGGIWPLRCKLREQGDCAILVNDGLSVFKREVREYAHRWGKTLITAAAYQQLGRRQRQCIARERPRAVPEHVAGELIKHQDVREGALGLVGPFAETTGDRSFDDNAKAPHDHRIEGVVLCEPFPSRQAMGRVMPR